MQRGRSTGPGRSESTRSSTAAEAPSPRQGGRCEISDMVIQIALAVLYPRCLALRPGCSTCRCTCHTPTGSARSTFLFTECVMAFQQCPTRSPSGSRDHCTLSLLHRALAVLLPQSRRGQLYSTPLLMVESHVIPIFPRPCVSVFCYCSTLMRLYRVFPVLLRLCGLWGVWRAHAIQQ